jgi:hypothetical protein
MPGHDTEGMLGHAGGRDDMEGNRMAALDNRTEPRIMEVHPDALEAREASLEVREGVDEATVAAVASLGAYKYGFQTDIETEFAPKGLNEDIVRLISDKNGEPEWMTDWRLQAYRRWTGMQEPRHWPLLDLPHIDFQDQYYYARPKSMADKPKSLDDVDPKLLETYKKLGIPLKEQEILAGVERPAGEETRKVAVDAVFDSVSLGTTFQAELKKAGVIFCPISEAIRDYPSSCASIWARSSRPPTTSTRRSTAPSSRRVLRLHPARGALPDGALHLLPHQCREHRASSSARSSSPTRQPS